MGPWPGLCAQLNPMEIQQGDAKRVGIYVAATDTR
jgi:hypothetical protein